MQESFDRRTCTKAVRNVRTFRLGCKSGFTNGRAEYGDMWDAHRFHDGLHRLTALVSGRYLPTGLGPAVPWENASRAGAEIHPPVDLAAVVAQASTRAPPVPDYWA